jgi:hypothetical protein
MEIFLGGGLGSDPLSVRPAVFAGLAALDAAAHLETRQNEVLCRLM